MTTLKRSILIFCFVLSSVLLCRAQDEQQSSPAPDAPTTTGTGTAGKLAKFTAATVLGDSIMTENNGKIGINVAPPTATLHVNGLQPAPVATNGTTPAMLLQTSGGKGGNTTGAGKTAGKGASILLAAGDGGEPTSFGTNGNGGDITLRPGARGAGPDQALSPPLDGNVLVAPTHGLVGIGTNSPDAKLDIVANASILNVTGATRVISAVLQVTNTSGSSPSPAVAAVNDAGIAVRGSSQSSDGVNGASQTGTGVSGTSADGVGVRGENTKSNYGVFGKSFLGAGVYGEGTNGTGVSGKSTGNLGTGVFGQGVTGVAGTSAANSLATAGVYGENTGGGYGVQGISTSGVGVRGEGTTGVQGISSGTGTAVYGQNPGSGYAGQFLGKTKFTANMEISGSEFFGNVTRQMLNLYNLDYGIGVQNNTLYFRSAIGYNWYKGGVHNNTQNSPGTGGISLMRLDLNGNLVVKGSVTATNFANSSDRAVKSNFANVDPRAVLDTLARLPVQTWSYKAEDTSVRHMGPMAQDFKAAFNLGTDDKTISTVDSAGVTMAAVQGLYQMMLEKEQRNEELAGEVRELRAQVTRLERAVKGEQRRPARRNRAR